MKYQVTITETIVRTYNVEVDTDEGEEQAKLLAEDLLVNYEEVEEASMEDERTIHKVVYTTTI